MFLTSNYGNNLVSCKLNLQCKFLPSQHLVCVNAGIFSLILVTLALNFLYRYWAVVKYVC